MNEGESERELEVRERYRVALHHTNCIMYRSYGMVWFVMAMKLHCTISYQFLDVFTSPYNMLQYDWLVYSCIAGAIGKILKPEITKIRCKRFVLYTAEIIKLYISDDQDMSRAQRECTTLYNTPRF